LDRHFIKRFVYKDNNKLGEIQFQKQIPGEKNQESRIKSQDALLTAIFGSIPLAGYPPRLLPFHILILDYWLSPEALNKHLKNYLCPCIFRPK
jgi:hypothetical protein